jgi:hypothetical protein
MSIDYGHGTTNIDTNTGIRHGVIGLNSVAAWIDDEIEYDYGVPTCPECGSNVVDTATEGISDYAEKDYFCQHCYAEILSDNEELAGCNLEQSLDQRAARYASHDSEQCFSEAPHGWSIDTAEYLISNCLDNDAMTLKSPYFTYAFFCSPCVPGAGNIDSPATRDDYKGGEACRAYCLGHEYFGGGAPYIVYSVATGEVVPYVQG